MVTVVKYNLSRISLEQLEMTTWKLYNTYLNTKRVMSIPGNQTRYNYLTISLGVDQLNSACYIVWMDSTDVGY